MGNNINTYRTNIQGNTIKEFEGKKHLVVPCIAVQEAVLNNELLLKEEIEKFVEAWNGIPLPVRHPKQNGSPISANSPEIIEKDVVGNFFNAKMENNKLKGEIWIDIEKCKKVNNNVLEMLMSNKPLEVSTAYFNETEVKSGTFNGKSYTGIQRNLRPDHLALLPDEIGACSWADGCGAPRINNKRGEKMSFKDKIINFIMGLDEELATNSNKEEETEKTKLISALVANEKTIFAEKDKEWLDTKTEEQLKGLFPCHDKKEIAANSKDYEEKKSKNEETENKEAKEEMEENKKVNEEVKAPSANEEKKPLTINEYIDGIPDEDAREFIANSIKKQKEHRTGLIKKLSENKVCEFEKEDLETMKTCYLEKLDRILSVNNSDFSGKGFQGRDFVSNKKDEDEIPVPPAVILENKKEGEK